MKFVKQEKECQQVDKLSGRDITSNLEAIKAAFNAINYRLTHDGFISVKGFYSELGLNEIDLDNVKTFIMK